jgi:DNA-directed RNA polymerase subunit RPC12/RpoP
MSKSDSLDKSRGGASHGAHGTALASSSMTLADTRRALSYFVSCDDEPERDNSAPDMLLWEEEVQGAESCEDSPTEKISEERSSYPVYSCVTCRTECPEAVDREAALPGTELVCRRCNCRIFEKQAAETPVTYSTD